MTGSETLGCLVDGTEYKALRIKESLFRWELSYDIGLNSWHSSETQVSSGTALGNLDLSTSGRYAKEKGAVGNNLIDSNC